MFDAITNINSWNSWLVNHGPLSLIRVSSKPWVAKSVHGLSTVMDVVHEFNMMHSIHLEYASTMIKNIFPMYGPAYFDYVDSEKKMRLLKEFLCGLAFRVLTVALILSWEHPLFSVVSARPCSSIGSKEIHCTFRHLTTIPKGISKQLERINLGYNNIHTIPQQAFPGLNKLQKLMLHGNVIQRIAAGAFSHLNSVQILKLSYNKIKVINSKMFEGLSSLIHLHIDHNKIEFIDPQTFFGLTALKSLQLESNLLQQLHPNTFVTFVFLRHFKISTLKHLYLSDNMLETLPPQMFYYMTELENLYLHANRWNCDCNLKWLVEWNKKKEGVIKCKNDRNHRNEQLCPRCSTPRMFDGSELFKIPPDNLSCLKPTIYSPLKLHNISIWENAESKLLTIEDFQQPIGKLALNLTDNQGAEANFTCDVLEPSHGTIINWQLKTTQEAAINMTMSIYLDCNVGNNIRRTWELIAYYSETPAKLQREVMLSKEPYLSYRYKQVLDNDASYYTGIKASLMAQPMWLMQPFFSIKLEREKTMSNKLFLNFTVNLSGTFNFARKHNDSWLMITQDDEKEAEHVVVEGTMLLLYCKVAGTIIPMIEWIFPNGMRTSAPHSSEDNRITISKNGKLIIKSVGISDSGIYYCVVTGGDDVDLRPYRVAVKELVLSPQAVNGETIYKYSGESIYLLCPTISLPEAHINWILPNNIIMSPSSPAGRFVVHNSSLTIKESSSEDNGYYSCLALNLYGVDMVSHKIIVTDRTESHFLKPKASEKMSSAQFFDQLEQQEASGNEEIIDSNQFVGSVTKESTPDLRPKGGRPQKMKDAQKNSNPMVPKFQIRGRARILNTGKNRTTEGKRSRHSRKRTNISVKELDPQLWAKVFAKAHRKSSIKTPSQFEHSATSWYKGDITTKSSFISMEEDLRMKESSASSLDLTQDETIHSTPTQSSGDTTQTLESKTHRYPMPPTVAIGSGLHQGHISKVTPGKPNQTNKEADHLWHSMLSSTFNPTKQPSLLYNQFKEGPLITDNLARSSVRRTSMRTTTLPVLIGQSQTFLEDSGKEQLQLLHKESSHSTTTKEKSKIQTSDTENQDTLFFQQFSEEKSSNSQHKAQPGSSQMYVNRQHKAQPGSSQTYVNSQHKAQPGSSQTYINRQHKAHPESSQTYVNRQHKAQPGSSQIYVNSQHKANPKSSQIYTNSHHKANPKPSQICINTCFGYTVWQNFDEPESVSALAESDVFLHCNVVGEPQPSVSWTNVSSGTTIQANIKYSQRFEVFRNGTFVIRNVQLQDQGQYICTAYNSRSSDRVVVMLAVIAHPPKMQFPRFQDVTAYLGQDALLQCKAVGKPRPQIAWLLPDKSFIRSTSLIGAKVTLLPNGTLRIRESNFSDKGNYKCIASNTAGAETIMVHLRVVALPPVINEEKSENVVLIPGQSVYIHCTSKGMPEPLIRWTLPDGIQIKTSQFLLGKLFVFPNGTLYIRNASPRDTGNYECVATNLVGTSRRTLNVQVKTDFSLPKISSTSLKRTQAIYGSTIYLECSTSGNPEPKVIWKLPSRKYVDSSYSSSSHVTVFHNGTLIVQSVTDQDAGEYMCVARNRMGDDILALRLDVVMKPAKIERKDNLRCKVTYGGEFKVDCAASGFPIPEITWSLPGGTMINNISQGATSSAGSRPYIIFNNGTLYFNQIGKNDEGDYTCYAENKVGKDLMKVNIEVIIKSPRIKEQEQASVKAKYGESVTLKCEAQEEPLHGITWLSPLNQIINVSEEKFQIRGVKLIIKRVTQWDSGNYACIMHNRLEDDVRNIKLEIVSKAPQINGYREDIVIKETILSFQKKLITCKADGIPEPTVMWITPHGLTLPAPSYRRKITVHLNGTLELRALRKPDSGTLICVARNEVGEARLMVQLEVINMPVKPTFAPPQNETSVIKPGSSTGLHCSVQGIPTPDITWILPNGTRLEFGKKLSKFHHKLNGTLYIANPTFSETGRYRCMAKNVAGYAEKLFMLVEGAKPKIQSFFFGLVSYLHGENLFLHCLTQGLPTPQVSWSLPNGTVLKSLQSSERASLMANGTLSIPNVNVQDRGTYTCSAVNEMGSATMSIPVIIVFYQPRITNSPPPSLTGTVGALLRLNCFGIGIPKVEIVWELPDGKQLSTTHWHPPSGQKYITSQGTLVLQTISFRDSGFYKCIARNVLGSDARTTYIKVL
uniref:matrix-remodeling-associated protein 5 n=1 Tax=Pristiophorus japonicus TaxID=55135 RepID=UPI00398F4C8C